MILSFWTNFFLSAPGHTIQDEGSSLPTQPIMDFVGAGVTATDGSGKTLVTIPGGGFTDYSFLIYRPSIAATEKNVYKTIGELLTAMAAHTGIGKIILDVPGVTVNIPVAAATYDFEGWIINNMNSGPTLDFADGTTLINFPRTIDGVTMKFNNTSAPVCLWNAAQIYGFFMIGGELDNAGTQPIIQVNNAGAIPIIVLKDFSRFVNTTFEVIEYTALSAASIPHLDIFHNSVVNANTIRGAANIIYRINSPEASYNTTQTNYSGTETPNYSHLGILKLTTAEKGALTPVNGDMVYDSTLNKFQGYENGVWTSFI